MYFLTGAWVGSAACVLVWVVGDRPQPEPPAVLLNTPAVIRLQNENADLRQANWNLRAENLELLTRIGRQIERDERSETGDRIEADADRRARTAVTPAGETPADLIPAPTPAERFVVPTNPNKN